LTPTTARFSDTPAWVVRDRLRVSQSRREPPSSKGSAPQGSPRSRIGSTPSFACPLSREGSAASPVDCPIGLVLLAGLSRTRHPHGHGLT
jgi:hypothetical protein